MKEKHLTSQSGHAIINGFYEGHGSVVEHLSTRTTMMCINVELWEDSKLREVRNLRDHNIHYAEDCAENWVTRVISKRKRPCQRISYTKRLSHDASQ